MSPSHQTRSSGGAGEAAGIALNYILLGLAALCALFPFLEMLRLSLGKSGDWSGAQPASLAAYQAVWTNPDLLTAYANSLFRTILGTVGTLICSCLCAYPLARPEFPQRRLFIFVVMATMIFSGGIVPTYAVIKSLGLVDNRLVCVLPLLVSAFNVMVLKSQFEAVPPSLGEAARIDGAGEWRILFQIYVPVCKPALATIALWTAVAHWNAWFDALLYLTSPEKQMLQPYLQRILIENNTELMQQGAQAAGSSDSTPEAIKAATVIVSMLPLLAIYPLAQRFFAKGALLGSVKE